MRDGRWEIGDERLEIGAVRRETGDAVMRRQVRGLQTSEMLGIPVILLLHHLTMSCLKKIPIPCHRQCFALASLTP